MARRGWAALVLIRRGFGWSGGLAENAQNPTTSDGLANMARKGAEDIGNAVEFMRSKPYASHNHTVVFGKSMGGFAATAYSTNPSPGVVAAISCAGGYRNRRVGIVSEVTTAYKEFGSLSKIPMLWLYSENDQTFPPAHAAEFYRAFTEGGGKAKFIQLPPFGNDGHDVEPFMSTWLPVVDDFLSNL